MKYHLYMGIVAATAAALFLGTFAIQQAGLNTAATADRPRPVAFDTIPLEGLSLDTTLGGPGGVPPGTLDFLLLVDSTPAVISSGHVAWRVACDATGESNIAILVGVAPFGLPGTFTGTIIDPAPVGPLSIPGADCLYHATIPVAGETITDVAMINNGASTISFGSGHFVTTSISAAED